MEPVLALRTRLYPHFRSGDFTFDLCPPPTRLRRYAASAARAVAERRLPFARGLLLAAREPKWWRTLAHAKRVIWNEGWLNHEGVHDAFALRDFEAEVQFRFREEHSVFVELPKSTGRRSFRILKAVSDAAFGSIGHIPHHAWWIY